jgi:hypothetical protein
MACIETSLKENKPSEMRQLEGKCIHKQALGRLEFFENVKV